MPTPRTPKLKAEVSGQAGKNPQRFSVRREPASAALGAAPRWMKDGQIATWNTLAHEIPWLNASHRGLLGIAVTIQARLEAGEDVGVQALNLLRQCLGQMGATPADATKVIVPDAGEGDPDEQFFGRPN